MIHEVIIIVIEREAKTSSVASRSKILLEKGVTIKRVQVVAFEIGDNFVKSQH